MYEKKLKQALDLVRSEQPDLDSASFTTMLTTTAENLLGSAEDFSAEDLAKTEQAIRQRLHNLCGTIPIALINLMLTILQAIEEKSIPNYQFPCQTIFSDSFSDDHTMGYQIRQWSNSVGMEKALSIKNWYIFLQLLPLSRMYPFLLYGLVPQAHLDLLQLIKDYLNASLIPPESRLITALLFNANLEQGRQNIFGLSLDALRIVIQHLEILVANPDSTPEEILNQALTNFNDFHFFDLILILRLPRDQQLAPLLELCQYFVNHYRYDGQDRLLNFAPIQAILLTNFATHGMRIFREYPHLFALILQKFSDHDEVRRLQQDSGYCEEIIRARQSDSNDKSSIYHHIFDLIPPEVKRQHSDSLRQVLEQRLERRTTKEIVKGVCLTMGSAVGLILSTTVVLMYGVLQPKTLIYSLPSYLGVISIGGWYIRRQICSEPTPPTPDNTERQYLELTADQAEDPENPLDRSAAISAEAQLSHQHSSTADMLATLQERPHLILLAPELMPVCKEHFPTLAQLTARPVAIEPPSEHDIVASAASTTVQVHVTEPDQPEATATERTPLLQYPGF